MMIFMYVSWGAILVSHTILSSLELTGAPRMGPSSWSLQSSHKWPHSLPHTPLHVILAHQLAMLPKVMSWNFKAPHNWAANQISRIVSLLWAHLHGCVYTHTHSQSFWLSQNDVPTVPRKCSMDSCHCAIVPTTSPAWHSLPHNVN